MSVQNSITVRNAMLDAWETAIGTSAKVRLYTGAAPTNCGTAASGTMLVEWALGSDYSANASSGAKSLSATPLSATAAAAA